MNLLLPEKIVKGDTFSLEGTLDVAITDWKIRCQIDDDCGQVIKLATANSGGSDEQIEITDGTSGIFIITIAKTLTVNFADKAYIEIEVETDKEQIYTIHQGEIQFKKQRIDWETP